MKTTMIPFLLALCLTGVSCDAKKGRSTNGHAVAHERGYTQFEMLTIYLSIQNLAGSHPEMFRAKTVGQAFAANDTNFVHQIIAHLEGANAEVLSNRFNKTGQLVDAWGNRFKIILKTKASQTEGIGTNLAVIVAVTSNGPNGIDNDGSADDIHFDPREFIVP
jgi:hypothetical protein